MWLRMSLSKIKWINEDVLKQLSARLTSLSFSPNVDKLAKLALDVLIYKVNANELLKETKSKEVKNEIKRYLKQIEEIEKGIVKLYGLGLLSQAKWALHPKVEKAVKVLKRGRS
jgi:GTP-dependent phosphoenolpyruvate carboxykinase